MSQLPVNLWCNLQDSLCCWISCLHYWRGICNQQDSEDGCFINHPFFFLSCPLFPLCWIHHSKGMKDIFNFWLEELNEPSLLICCTGDCYQFGQLVCECAKVLVRGHVWHLAVLWEKFCGTQDLICSSLRNVVQVTSVVVHWWAQVPSIHTLQCPWSFGVAIFVENCFASQWGKGILVSIIGSIECFVRWDSQVDPCSSYQIECVLDLVRDFVPQLQWKVTIGWGKRSNEGIIEGLYNSLCSIHSMVVRFNKL